MEDEKEILLQKLLRNWGIKPIQEDTITKRLYLSQIDMNTIHGKEVSQKSTGISVGKWTTHVQEEKPKKQELFKLRR